MSKNGSVNGNMNVNKNKTKKKKRRLSFKMKKKLIIFYLLIFIALGGLGGVLFFIKNESGEAYSAAILAQQEHSSKSIPFKRGDISDRNGNVLATSVKVYNLILDPYIIRVDEDKYLEPTIEALTKSLPELMTRESIMKVLQEHEGEKYVKVIKQLTYDQIRPLQEIIENTSENPLVKGVWLEEEYKREYPYDTVASATIGFTVAGDVGNWGIEEYYNDELNGMNGRSYGYVNSDNNMQPKVVEPEDGNSVVSTIDLNLQRICEKYVVQWKETYTPTNVTVVMADPNNGEILAMACSNNMFSLNNPRNLEYYYTTEQIKAMPKEEQLEKMSQMWRNFCISDTYESGSTFKPFTIAAALEEGKVGWDQTFMCDGAEVIGPHTIHCHLRSGHGPQTLEQAIMNSCNDTLMQVAAATGKDIFCEYQAKFGFGMKTGIDLPGESSAVGLLYTPDNMSEAALATNSFGQNFNVTAIQMVAGFSALINGGNYYKPHVVKQIVDSKGGVVENIGSTLIKQVVTKKTSEFLKTSLLRTVEAGTAKTAAAAGYKVGGKTGTAQHLDKKDPNYLLSFLGYAPYDNPKVVCYAIVDSPNVDNKGSSSYACQLFSAVMTEALPYLKIFPTEPVPEDENPEEATSAPGTVSQEGGQPQGEEGVNGEGQTQGEVTNGEETNGEGQTLGEGETTIPTVNSADENYSDGGFADGEDIDAFRDLSLQKPETQGEAAQESQGQEPAAAGNEVPVAGNDENQNPDDENQNPDE